MNLLIEQRHFALVIETELHKYATGMLHTLCSLMLSCVLLSGMRGTSPSLWVASREQERRCQPNTPWDTLPRSAALPARPTLRRKSWLPTPSWRWWTGGGLLNATLYYLGTWHKTGMWRTVKESSCVKAFISLAQSFPSVMYDYTVWFVNHVGWISCHLSLSGLISSSLAFEKLLSSVSLYPLGLEALFSM